MYLFTKLTSVQFLSDSIDCIIIDSKLVCFEIGLIIKQKLLWLGFNVIFVNSYFY